MINHDTLVKKARSWLINHCGCVVTITELVAGREVADAIGFTHRATTLIECKINRSDFLADAKKCFRRVPGSGMGERRYYLAERGLIEIDELPSGWGLLELCGMRIYETKKSDLHPTDHRSEMGLLISIIRRVGLPGEGVTVNFYRIPATKKPKGMVIVKADEGNPK